MRTKMWRLPAVIGALALIVSACGSSTDESGSGSSTKDATSSQSSVSESSSDSDTGGETSSDTGGESSADAPEACDITYLTFQSPALPASFWEGVVKEATANLPGVNVKIEYTPGLDRQGYATQLLASGELPDVVEDVPLREFAKAGALLPFDEEKWQALGMPDDVGRIDGKHYSLAIGSQPTPLIFYNADKFKQYGLEEPKTYADFTKIVQTLKDAGETPLLMGGGSDPWASVLLLEGFINTDVMAKNPDWVLQRRDGAVHFTDADFKAAVTKWSDMITGGFMNSDAMGLGYDQLIAKYLNGEGVMYPMGAWAAAQDSTFAQGVFLLPTDDGATKVMGNTPAAEIYVSATTKCPEAAQDFAIALSQADGFINGWLKSDALFPLSSDFQLPDDIGELIKKTADVMRTPDVTVVDPFAWMNGERSLPAGFADEFYKGAQELYANGDVDAFLSEMDSTFDDLNTN